MAVWMSVAGDILTTRSELIISVNVNCVTSADNN